MGRLFVSHSLKWIDPLCEYRDAANWIFGGKKIGHKKNAAPNKQSRIFYGNKKRVMHLHLIG